MKEDVDKQFSPFKIEMEKDSLSFEHEQNWRTIR